MTTLVCRQKTMMHCANQGAGVLRNNHEISFIADHADTGIQTGTRAYSCMYPCLLDASGEVASRCRNSIRP